VPGTVDDRAQPIAPAAVTAMLARPEVAAATRYCRTQLPVQGGALPQPAEVDVVGVGPTPRWTAAFPLLGAPDATARAALATGAGAWVSEPLAFRWQLRVGAPLRITTPAGVQELPIAAVYRDYSNERGEVMVGADWLARHAGAPATALCFEVRADVAQGQRVHPVRADRPHRLIHQRLAQIAVMIRIPPLPLWGGGGDRGGGGHEVPSYRDVLTRSTLNQYCHVDVAHI
jgi:hypothetical protein